jgi:hypothetical protein
MKYAGDSSISSDSYGAMQAFCRASLKGKPMPCIDYSFIRYLETTALAIVAIDPIGAVRLVLLASELRAGWRA